MTESAVRVAVLFPELLGTYGDGGNVLVLRQRLRWRGLVGEFVSVGLTEPVPHQCDLYVIGGGEDDAQAQALQALHRSSGLQQAAERGAQVLAVCAGLQILGRSVTDRHGRTYAGLGLLDIDTRPLPRRAVGEVVAEPAAALGLPMLRGFTNHGGGTRLGPQATPLATVRTGVGNDGPQRSWAGSPAEGVLQGSVLATYLHGPVLARNPALADLVLARALGRSLPPLPMSLPASLSAPVASGQPGAAPTRSRRRSGARSR